MSGHTVTISGDTLAELYDVCTTVSHGETVVDGEGINGWFAVGTEELGDGRWSTYYRMVVRRGSDGKLFSCDFSEGLTENQDNEYPWYQDSYAYSGRETNPVECYEVRQTTRTVTITEYEPVKGAG